MEIIVIGIIGFIGWLWFKGSVISKSKVSSIIQKAFEIVERTTFLSFEGDKIRASQAWVELCWQHWGDMIKRENLRPPFIALFILKDLATILHDKKDQNFEFVLQALFVTLKEVLFRFQVSASLGELTILDSAKETFDKLMRATMPKGMETLYQETPK